MIVWKEEDKRVHHCKIQNIIVSVHGHIDYPKDTWLVSCYPLGISKVGLNNKELEKAKIEALYFIKKRLLCYSMVLRFLENEMKSISQNNAFMHKVTSVVKNDKG